MVAVSTMPLPCHSDWPVPLRLARATHRASRIERHGAGKSGSVTGLTITVLTRFGLRFLTCAGCFKYCSDWGSNQPHRSAVPLGLSGTVSGTAEDPDGTPNVTVMYQKYQEYLSLWVQRFGSIKTLFWIQIMSNNCTDLFWVKKTISDQFLTKIGLREGYIAPRGTPKLFRWY